MVGTVVLDPANDELEVHTWADGRYAANLLTLTDVTIQGDTPTTSAKVASMLERLPDHIAIETVSLAPESALTDLTWLGPLLQAERLDLYGHALTSLDGIQGYKGLLAICLPRRRRLDCGALADVDPGTFTTLARPSRRLCQDAAPRLSHTGYVTINSARHQDMDGIAWPGIRILNIEAYKGPIAPAVSAPRLTLDNAFTLTDVSGLNATETLRLANAPKLDISTIRCDSTKEVDLNLESIKKGVALGSLPAMECVERLTISARDFHEPHGLQHAPRLRSLRIRYCTLPLATAISRANPSCTVRCNLSAGIHTFRGGELQSAPE